MKRFSPLLAVLVLLVSLTSVTQAQSRSVLWERWDVVIDDIDTSANTFTVSEIYDIRFFGTFTFGQAVIPLERVESIDEVRVSQDGRALTARCGGGAGTYCVRNTTDGLSIVYYFFSAISDRTANIVLEYRVNGGLRVYPDGDQLWWIGVAEEKYGYSVNASTLRVNLPAEYAPRAGVDPVVTYGAQSNVTVEGGTVIATALNGVRPDETFEIRVQYPHDPNARKASWQDAFDEQRNFDETVRPWLEIGGILGGFLLALLGTLFVYYRWFTRGRDPKIGPVPQYLSELPSNLPPAMVGTLIDENAELRDIVSTLIDLANRGYIAIQEEAGRGKFSFKRLIDNTDGLRKYEAHFMQCFFAGRNTVSLASLRNRFYTHIPTLQRMVYDELVKEEMFRQSPEDVRNTWAVLAMMVLFGGVGLIFILFQFSETIGKSLICLPGGIIISGLAMLLFASAMPSKTQKGAEEAAKWKAFREYMRNLQQYQDVGAAAENFSRYLAYAVAFGFERSWIRRFEKVDVVGLPPWYYPRTRHYGRGGTWGTGGGSGTFTPSSADVRPGDLARAGGGLDDLSGGLSSGLSSISDGLTQMLNSASSTLNSRPQSSGSSGSWGGGGGSFSGGGSFGGGGGGGGSRGFG